MDLELQCPHCLEYVLVCKTELNCCIFRHAAYAGTLAPLNPHAPEEVCTRLKAEGVLLGCAKPFRVVLQPDGTYTTEPCGYI